MKDDKLQQAYDDGVTDTEESLEGSLNDLERFRMALEAVKIVSQRGSYAWNIAVNALGGE